MDIVTLGAALNGSAEYVNSHFKGGSNIQIVDNPDGTQTINASGEVSSEDTVARAEIAEMKDGETLDSFGDVETALGDKADTSTTYTKTEVDTALSAKANSADVYSKTAVDTALSAKADKSTTYTKTEVDTALGNKADKSTTYTKTEVDTALGGKVDKETGKGLSTNDFTTDEKSKLAGIATGAEVNVQSDWNQITDTADDYIKNKPTLGTAAAKNATDTYNATGDDVTTGKAVAAALATLPEPMIFKGSLGTGGTITTLPTASNSNKGYVYKVITAGTYASQSAKVGDTFISDGSAWVLIPSGDEPSGTVTNVAVADGGGLTVSGSPITSSGTITVGHSNSVTAKTSSSLKKFTYDAYGHVTDSSELSTAESDVLASGIDSTKVAQIETNKNNISKLTPNYAISVCPVTNDYSCIAALTQTIPTASIARISATINKGNTSVRGIILSLTDDISTFNNGDNLLAKDEQSVSDKRILTVDAMYYNGSSSNTIPVYIWVKGEGTGAVMGYSSLEKLK